MSNSFLRGAYTPVITPFKNGAVDYEAFAQFVDWQISHGSHGIVVGGTAGEFTALSVTERENLLRVALSVAKRRAFVVAQTGAASAQDTLSLTEHAGQAGAAAVLVLTPMYAKPTQAGLVSFYREVGRRTDRPLLIYQNASRTSVSVNVETLASIFEGCPNLVGMKQSDEERSYSYAVLGRYGSAFRLFMGSSQIAWDMIPDGAAGLIVALANIVPRAIRQICDNAAQGDTASAMRIHESIATLNSAAFLEPSPGPIKYMAWRMGLIPHLEYRLPLIPPSADLAARLDVALDASGLLPPH
jgi:4-hydroxy-tetrahydrodipicolinate synthase